MDLINLYSKEFNIPYEAARALVKAESSFNHKAVSPKGAQGLTQMMPITQREMGVTDPFDPEQSIKGGLGYYAKQREKYGPIGALYAYNWGPTAYGNYLEDISKGKKRTIPKETEEYVNRLAPLFGPTAPMDLQGRPQVPEMLPVSQSVPQQETQMQQTIPPQSTGTPPQDDYESMKIFNPYVQMALGILAGNRGGSKGEAFANAAGGGLAALNAAQRSSAYAGQVRAQRDQYELMKQKMQMQQQYAMQKAQDPNLSPEQREAWKMAAMSGNLGDATKQLNEMTSNAMQEKRINLEERRLQQDINKETNKGNSFTGLNLEEGHPMKGWKVDEKGNLYDNYGVEVTGSRKDYAGEMIPRPAKDVIPQRVWMDKNDPTRKVLPQDFSNWIDKEGNYLTESAPVEDIVSKGYRYVDDKERADYRAAKTQLDQIKTQWQNLFGEDGVYTKVKEFKGGDLNRLMAGGKSTIAGTGIGDDKTSIKIREWNKFVDRTLPSYAREIGHTGVLTQLDVDSVRPSIGMITPEYLKGKFLPDTEEEAKNGLRTLYKLYKSRGIENKELDAMMAEMESSSKGNKELFGTLPDGTTIYKR